MATRSVIGYYEGDKFYGTYVHYDGFPDVIMPALKKRFADSGYEGFKKWVDKGRWGQGYSSVDDETPNSPNSSRSNKNWTQDLMAQEYGYSLNSDGELNAYNSYKKNPLIKTEKFEIETDAISFPELNKPKKSDSRGRAIKKCNVNHRSQQARSACAYHRNN